MGKNSVSQKIYSLTEFSYKYFARVKFQPQFTFQKIVDSRQYFFEIFFISMNNNKVVSVAEIIFYPKLFFNEPVQFVEIYVGKNLRSDIADRHSSFL